ncbi:MAG TPA: hypothetical protein VLQ93_13375, partial [Myxococcaceae bacterium]|nr:hypothetical protein [Myxococcaceae bacterium]
EPAPSLIQADAVRMPRRVFVDEPQIERFLQLSGGPERGPLPETAAGHIDTFGVEGNKVELTGWAPWEGVNNAQGLELRANRTITRATLQPVVRPDVALALGNSRYLHSGFLVRLELEEAPQAGSPSADDLELCVVAVDREAGTAVRLHAPPGLATCR